MINYKNYYLKKFFINIKSIMLYTYKKKTNKKLFNIKKKKMNILLENLLK